jgi:hypothetical protein
MEGINMYSNCCCAPPEENSSDVCSECKEHADFINEGEIEIWIEFAPDDKLSEVADKKCKACYGKGLHSENPDPLLPGTQTETYVCDCLDYEKIQEILNSENL